MRKNLWRRFSLAFIGVLIVIAANNIQSYAGEPGEIQTDGENLEIPVKQIDFMFGINSDNSIYQTVTFVLSDKVTGKTGEKIEKYMKEKFEKVEVPGLMFDTDLVDGYTSYSYIRSNAALETCDELLTELFGDGSADSEVEDLSGSFSPFTFASLMTMDFDITVPFVGEEGECIPCFFFMERTNDYNYFVAESVEEARNWDFKYTKTDRSGRCDLIYKADYTGNRIHFPLWVVNQNRVKHIEVNSDRSGDEWVRVSAFRFERPVCEETALHIRENFEEMAAELEAGQNDGRIQVAGEWEENDFKLLITQKGDSKFLSKSSELLFGTESDLEYERESPFWKIRKEESYKGNIDYSRILEKVPVNFRITYTAPVGWMANCGYCNYEYMAVEDGMLKISTREYGVNLDYEGTLIDGMAVVLWIVAAAVPFSVAVAAVRRICRKRKVQTGGKKQVYFCPKCGTLMKSEKGSCPRCGMAGKVGAGNRIENKEKADVKVNL